MAASSPLAFFSRWGHAKEPNVTKVRKISRFRYESRAAAAPRNSSIIIPYDKAGQSLVTFGTLPLFPVQRKIRPNILNNFEHYGNALKGKLGHHMMIHFVYNPTLLPLTDESRRRIGIDANNGSPYAEAAYLGTFRISNFGNCRGPIQGLMPTGRFKNYLGLALFDTSLQLLHDSSSYFKLRLKTMKLPFTPSPSPGPTMPPTTSETDEAPRNFFDLWENALQDCSLYDKHSRFYLLCNGYIAPVTIRLRDKNDENWSNTNSTNTGAIPEPTEAKVEYKRRPGKLRLIQDHPWIPLDPFGKNLHIFEDIHNNTYLEVWPTSPKLSIRIRLEEEEIMRMTVVMMNSPLHYHNNTILSEELLYNDNVSSSSSTTATTPTQLLPQQPSFAGPMEDMWEPLWNPLERGTACCITVFLRERDKAKLRYDAGNGSDDVPLRVGVVHLKDDQSNYLNRFYAFEAIAPFRDVAKSGLFCLGFGVNDSAVATERPELMPERYGNASTLNVWIVNRHFDCPKIQFVSGITEKVDDPNSVILSYGINDCYPRMVVVSKDAILNLLFPDTTAKGMAKKG